MMEKDEQLCTYFDEAETQISEANVTFTESLKDIKAYVNPIEMHKYTRIDLQTMFRTDHRQTLKQNAFHLL